MALFFGNSYCNLCQSDGEQLKDELAAAYLGMASKGLSPPQDAYYSARMPKSTRIVKTVHNGSRSNDGLLSWFDVAGNNKNTDFETALHSAIYSRRPDVNSIFSVKSYYLFSAIQDGFLETVHAEAALILGDIPIINTEQLGQDNLVERIGNACVGEPLRPIRVIIIQRRGAIGLGACIHESRAFIEILEEWAKYKALSNAFGGTKSVITLDGLRGVGARHARAIKFGGRQAAK